MSDEILSSSFPGHSTARFEGAQGKLQPKPAPGSTIKSANSRLEAQVAQLHRAAAFLARDPAAVRGTRPMPRRVMGNGLRELDIFLVDIVATAAGLRRVRRVYCAAEAWRRAGPGMGLALADHTALVQLRAAQNRMAFEPVQFWVGPPYPLALACAAYGAMATAVLATVGNTGLEIGPEAGQRG